MKILYAGNLANVGYYHVKKLRQKGVDIELVMETNPPAASDPFLRDKDLKEYPNWIRFYDKNLSSWKLDLIRIMRESQYDLIHAHVELPIFSYLSRKKFIVTTLGSDLTEMAFSNSIRGFLLRRAYRKAKMILYNNPIEPSLLDNLKIKRKFFLPIIFDIFNDFKLQKFSNKFFSNKFVIFHPSSHIWDVKGNDKLIIAYANFLKTYPNSILICINVGQDVDKSKKLVQNLGIHKNVQFIQRLNVQGLNYYYNLATVVADQFILHGLGGIGFETLCCEKPLITLCSEDAYKNMHSEPPPIFSAFTIEEIYHQLEYIHNYSNIKEIGRRGKNWLNKFQSSEILTKKYMIVYEGIHNNESISTIKLKIDNLST
jgi:glycosyltransferase involved in cell wall biosynthesis